MHEISKINNKHSTSTSSSESISSGGEQEQGQGHLSIVGLSYGNWLGAESGMLSYPNYDGINKPLDIPDIVTLATLAETVKLDFRIILLYRTNIKSMLISYTNRFNMNFFTEAQIMINACSNLYSQLKLIDRKFVHCVHFESFTGKGSNSNSNSTSNSTSKTSLTEQQKQNLINFVHPQVLNQYEEEMWDTIQPKKSTSSSSATNAKAKDDEDKDRSAHEDFLIWRLQREVSLIEEYCKQQ